MNKKIALLFAAGALAVAGCCRAVRTLEWKEGNLTMTEERCGSRVDTWESKAEVNTLRQAGWQRGHHSIYRAPACVRRPRTRSVKTCHCPSRHRHSPPIAIRGGSFILRARPKCGLTTATAASFLTLNRRAAQIPVGPIIAVGSHVQCQRKCFHVC